eukprot:g62635.t1
MIDKKKSVSCDTEIRGLKSLRVSRLTRFQQVFFTGWTLGIAIFQAPKINVTRRHQNFSRHVNYTSAC